MKILVLADVNQKRLEQAFPDMEFTYAGYALDTHIPSSYEEVKELIKGQEILISEFDTIDKDIIDNADKLKLIVCCRGGVHTVIDVAYAAQKGIIVKNTPARNASSVAQYIIGLLFVLDRKLLQANNAVLSDKLQRQTFYLPEKYRDSLWGMDKHSPYHVYRGKGVHNLTLGVIGYGNIGKYVVNMAVVLGIHVLVFDKHQVVSPIPAGVQIVDLDYLLANSDYISVHCSNKDHKAIIGEREFMRMKNGAYFINTARGDLIDEDALIKALNSGHLAGAALDVTKNEPLLPNSPLIKANNIFITPHIAGSTDEVIDKGTEMAIYHVRDFLDNMEEF